MQRRLAILVVTALAVSAAWVAPAQAGTFEDVPEGVWYEAPVEWLVSAGITNGTSDTTFSPGAFVTRAQMAAFLARFGEYAADSPDAGFVDVVEGAFYDAPVDWLLERGITQGTSATTYSPGAFVTRAQMAAFLWRFAGRVPSDTATPFVDVPATSWYAEAVAWLLENGITQGTSATTFSPGANVTRAQMAAFLWRLAGQPAPGEPGTDRVAALPLGASGGEFVEGDVVVTIAGLSGDGFVKVLTGEGGGQLASLDGAVSDDIEIVVSQAELAGPVTVTAPIDMVDLDAVDLVVFVLDENGQWEQLSIEVTTEIVGEQIFATFTLPAGVSLAPSASGWSLFAAGDFERIVVRVAANALPAPTTTSTTTTVPPIDHPVIDVSAMVTEYVSGQAAESYVGAQGGTGTYVDFRATGLPAGLSIAVEPLGPFTVGSITGTPTETGTFYVTVEVEDDAGGTDSEIVAVTVVPNAQEGNFDTVVGSSRTGFYPTVTPDGRYMSFSSADFGSTLGVIDLESDTVITSTSSSFNFEPVEPAPVADGGAFVTFVRSGEVVQRDTTSDTEVVIANQAEPKVVASGDGRYVAFASRSDLSAEADQNSVADVFIWDRDTDSIARVTNPSSNEPSYVRGVSDDFRYLLLYSEADLLGGADPATEGTYLYDRVGDSLTRVGGGWQSTISPDGSTVYVQDEGDITMWQRSAPGVITTVVSGDGFTSPVLQASSDGGYLTFASFSTDLVPGDDNDAQDLFTWDRANDSLRRITADSGLDFVPGSWRMTDDGSVIVFRSSDDEFTPEVDRNGGGFSGSDVFLWNRSDGSYERITNGQVGVWVAPVWITPDGGLVWFLRDSGDGWVQTWDRAAAS